MDKEHGELKEKRIFIGFNDAGSAGIYSFTRILRQLGYKIDFYGYNDIWVKVPVDFLLIRPRNRLLKEIFGLYYFFKVVFKYDIFHFNFAGSFFLYRWNYLVLKFLNKKIVNTFRGSDVYDVKKSVELLGQESPYYNFKNKLGLKKIESRAKKIDFITKNSDRVILIGPWLVGSISRYDEIIPYSRDIQKIHLFKKEGKYNNKFTVLHAPTNKDIKGTGYIIKSIESLKKRGFNISLDLVEKISVEELYKRISQADVIIDQLLLGWYGGFAVEAMALEKPVICYLKEEYKNLVPFGREIPIINSSKETLETTLKQAIADQEDLKNLGKKGYQFVLKYHDAEVVAKQYRQIYENL